MDRQAEAIAVEDTNGPRPLRSRARRSRSRLAEVGNVVGSDV